MNYDQETSKLSEGNYWKPKTGNYQVTPLEEIPEPKEKTFNKSNGTTEKTMQSEWKVKVNNETKTWTISVAQGKASLWGQLMQLGKARGNLAGKPFFLGVMESNGKRQYFIQDLVQVETQIVK